MSLEALRSQSLSAILRTAVQARRWELITDLYQRLGGVVQAGPFRGMRIPGEPSWADGDIGSRLLGMYEEELSPTIERILKLPIGGAVVIGCAEGYYAIGLAKRAPNWRVFAFDTSQKAQALCAQAAAENGVGNRVTIAGQCRPEDLQAALASIGPAFVLCDCEGAEIELMDVTRVPALMNCTAVIECHDFMVPDVTRKLAERLSTTHTVEVVVQGGRNPSAAPVLRASSDLDRWLLISEGRPCVMSWLVISPRTANVG